MQAHKKFPVTFIIVCFVSFAAVCIAEEAAAPAFPYIAEIISDNVNIRSGPGTNYYRCGNLNTGAKVRVVSSKFSWSQIVPPEGSFSWISKQFVSVDAANPTVGTVTGDGIRVYAGSPDREPIHSEIPQLKLNTNDKVTLIGGEISDYYKIVPPAGAYLWVSTSYVRPLGAVGEVVPTAVEKPAQIVQPSAPPQAPADTPLEATKLKEYYNLQKQIEAERAKPMEQQNYAAIKKSLLELAGRKDAGKAARYAAFAVGQVERCELALSVGEQLKVQDEQLIEIQQRIEKARIDKLTNIKEMGRFAVMGQFQTSNVYGTAAEQPVRYRIIDDSGKTICYAVAADAVAGTDLSKFVGQKVGLTGTIEPHPQTKGALVRFTAIEELK